MQKFKKKDIGKKVRRVSTNIVTKRRWNENWEEEIKEETITMVVEDTIVSVPGESKYEKKYNSIGIGLNSSGNKKGVMLKDHPWEPEDNWELINKIK